MIGSSQKSAIDKLIEEINEKNPHKFSQLDENDKVEVTDVLKAARDERERQEKELKEAEEAEKKEEKQIDTTDNAKKEPPKPQDVAQKRDKPKVRPPTKFDKKVASMTRSKISALKDDLEQREEKEEQKVPKDNSVHDARVHQGPIMEQRDLPKSCKNHWSLRLPSLQMGMGPKEQEERG